MVRSRPPIVFGIIFLLFGTGFAGVGIYIINIGKDSETWHSTQGYITKTYITDTYDSDDQDYTYYPHVEYQFIVNDQQYTGDSLTPGGINTGYSTRDGAQKFLEKYPVGSSVIVYYDPDNPQQNALSIGTSGGAYIFTGLGILFAIIGLLITIGGVLRNNKRIVTTYDGMSITSYEQVNHSVDSTQEITVIYCQECGNPCHPDSKYCPVCNAPLY